ncbi:hypothetical protein HQ563_18880 [bacterium]|nr:hypothetical protein [bacterium]
MIKPPYVGVLRKLHVRLNEAGVKWVVTGSVSFAIQGLPVEPNDIDIQTDRAGAYEIERLFSEFVTKRVAFSSTEKIRSHFGALLMDGIEVEIMGDLQKRLGDGTWEPPLDLNRHKRFVEAGGMRIPVLSLEYEYEAYLKLGRTEKAQLLKQWLRAHRAT